jgi:hypothetical protein
MTPSEKAFEFVARHMQSGKRLITSSPKEFKPGDRIEGIKGGYFDDDGRFRIAPLVHPFAVVRECTYNEWLASWPDDVPRNRPEAQNAAGWRFYEITTD